MALLITLGIALLSPSAHAEGLSPSEAAQIEYLIESVGRLQDARFIRNGRAHDARSAANHLRRKWKAAGTRVKSAEDFIVLCASASSVTGKPYRIRFSDGRVIDAAQYFRQKLVEYPNERRAGG
jgi:hypothetical protein